MYDKTNFNIEVNQKMPLADAMVMALRDLGVEHLFGVSGANIENLHDAVFRLGEGKLSNRLCKSEIGAAFMADGYSRFKDTIGVCCCTSGGGMMNMAVGVAESRASGVPLLAIVGCPPSYLTGQGAFQDASGNGLTVDAKMLWQSISKCVIELTAEHFWEQLFHALTESFSKRPGPSSLLIPRDIIEQQVSPRPSWWPSKLSAFKIEDELPKKELLSLVSAINDARSAVIFAGPEVGNQNELVKFSNFTGIPVATTLGATGAYPNNHPNFLGTVGAAGLPSVHTYLSGCDLIIVLGCQLEAMIRAPFETTLLSKNIYIINTCTSSSPKHLDVNTITACPNRVLKYLNGNKNHLIKKLNPEKLPQHTHYKPQTYSYGKTPELNTGEQILKQSEALTILQSFIPQNGNLLFDAGNCAAAAAHYLTIPDGTRSLVALGMGGMGYAICAAIGIQLAKPKNQTMVISGDGAFLMTGMEIHSAIEWRLPILWVFFNNSQHGMCTSRQRHFFENRITCTQYGDVNIDRVVSGLDSSNTLWHGQAKDATEMKFLLEDYYAKDSRPGVLELKIGIEEIPPFFPLARETW
ncbi:MAG: thiamine pyrophosphate-binding protein [Proteobacteria bacterium]|nr:thiamine pyrophosphate-binding protein [Pseudomonadota bacterium]